MQGDKGLPKSARREILILPAPETISASFPITKDDKARSLRTELHCTSSAERALMLADPMLLPVNSASSPIQIGQEKLLMWSAPRTARDC